jgi:hypothetical protein
MFRVALRRPGAAGRDVTANPRRRETVLRRLCEDHHPASAGLKRIPLAATAVGVRDQSKRYSRLDVNVRKSCVSSFPSWRAVPNELYENRDV